MSALQYYVYYKFDPKRIDEVRTTVHALFAGVSSATGIQGQWQQRRDDASTFMETYFEVADGAAFERALSQAVENSGFAKLGIRRVTEIFQCA